MDEVRDAVTRLQGMADARPELAPVVAVALEVVRSARDEVRDAAVRAELAEEAVAKVRPHLDEVAKRAEEAEARLAERDEIDAAEDARRRREAAEAEELRRAMPEMAAKVWEMAGRVERLAEETAKSNARTVQLLAAIHASVKNEDGQSPIQCFRERGEWTVRDVDGAVIAETGSRAEAVHLVKSLLDRELAEAAAVKSADEEREDELYSPAQDTVHRDTPWRKPAKQKQKKRAHIL